MEKKLTNSGPFMASTSKHGIYPSEFFDHAGHKEPARTPVQLPGGLAG
jgi:hypothetical protein